MSVKQKTRRMKNKTTKTSLKHTMAESSNNKYFFLSFHDNWHLLRILKLVFAEAFELLCKFFFSYKLIWDFEVPLKIVEGIPNFAKRFCRNNKLNTLLGGIVIFVIYSQIWTFQNKVVFLGSTWVFFSFATKSFEESFENHD